MTAALVAWQETGDERSLESLVAMTLAELQHLAVVSLRRHGIADRSAVDDTLSLVLNHLRRLPGAAPGERAVSKFDAGRTSSDRSGDTGKAYLAWLVRERSLDVARQRRRLAKYRVPLSDDAMHGWLWADTHDAWQEDHEQRVRLGAAIVQLEPQLRTVAHLLLEGKSQAVIAHMLDVCEGTVSRLRTKAIVELKRLMET